MTIKLGDLVTDSAVTDFTGIVVSLATHMYASPTVGVQSQTLCDGSPGEVIWFDLKRLGLYRESAVGFGVEEVDNE